MRWSEKPIPKHSGTRVVTRFLWFPLTIKGETRWLEKVSYRQSYSGSCYNPGWDGMEWLDNVHLKEPEQ